MATWRDSNTSMDSSSDEEGSVNEGSPSSFSLTICKDNIKNISLTPDDEVKELVRDRDDSGLFHRLKKTRGGAVARSHAEQLQQDISRLGDALKKQYNISSSCRYIPLIPSTKMCVHEVEKLYVTNTIVQHSVAADIPIPVKKEPRQVVTKNQKRQLIRGPSGIGKTTEIKMWVKQWCDGDVCGPLQQFHLVFLLNGEKLKKMSKLSDAILDQCLPDGHGFSARDIRHICENAGDKILIVLDNFTKLPADILTSEHVGNIAKMIQCKIFESVHVIVLTTPDRVHDFRHIYRRYTHFEVTGFSSESIEEYVTQKIFTSSKERREFGKNLLANMRERNLMDGMASQPIILCSFCQCAKWVENPTDLAHIDTSTSLLKELVTCMLQHSDTTRDALPGAFNEETRHDNPTSLSEDHSEQKSDSWSEQKLLQKLGEVAFRCCFEGEEGKHWVSASDFQCEDSERVMTEAFNRGLLIRRDDETINPSHFRATKGEVMTFPSSLMKKYLAGSHLARLKEGSESDHSLFESTLHKLHKVSDVAAVRDVLNFSCGSSTPAARDIVGHLSKLAQNIGGEADMPLEYATGMCLEFNYESRSKGNLNDVLGPIFARAEIISTTAYSLNNLKYLLNYAVPEPEAGFRPLDIEYLKIYSTLAEMDSRPPNLSSHFQVQWRPLSPEASTGPGSQEMSLLEITGKSRQPLAESGVSARDASHVPRSPANVLCGLSDQLAEGAVKCEAGPLKSTVTPVKCRDDHVRDGLLTGNTVHSEAGPLKSTPMAEASGEDDKKPGLLLGNTERSETGPLKSPLTVEESTDDQTQVPQFIDHHVIKKDELEHIADGSYGTKVYKWRWSNRDVAVKEIQTDKKGKDEVSREIRINKKLSHPNIVRLLAFASHQPNPTTNFRFYLIMDFVDGFTLYDAIFENKYPQLEERPMKLSVAAKVCAAVAHIHEMKCTHSDLKSNNVLIRRTDGEPFVCDMGFGHMFNSSHQRMSTHGRRGGVARYTPPEALLPGAKVSFPWDIWSLACILVELSVRQIIWNDCETDYQVICRLSKEDDVAPTILGEERNSCIREILRSCFTKEVSDRPTANELKKVFEREQRK